jgi:hypothetical protein
MGIEDFPATKQYHTVTGEEALEVLNSSLEGC